MPTGIPDHDYPTGFFAMSTAAASQVALGVLFTVLALTVECLQQLHAIVGGLMLISGTVLIVVIIRGASTRRAILQANSES